MKATEFEFRHRSILNLVHFWMAFQLYSVDHTNVVWAFVHFRTASPQMLAGATLVLWFLQRARERSGAA